MFKVPEGYRIRAGHLGSDVTYGNNGAFSISMQSGLFLMIASDEEGWEHVSVSKTRPDNRLPHWIEMCAIKDIFWDPEDVVMQLHPKASEYVNNFEVLHLWRPIGIEIPTPPSILVGIKYGKT